MATINRVGHIVLIVKDVEASVKFYTEVLGYRCSVDDHNVRFQDRIQRPSLEIRRGSEYFASEVLEPEADNFKNEASFKNRRSTSSLFSLILDCGAFRFRDQLKFP